MADTVFISTLRAIDWHNLPTGLPWSYWISLFSLRVWGVVPAAIFASIFVLVVKLTAGVPKEKQEVSAQPAA